MSCTIIVGGQYGSEGKGKTVGLEVRRMSAPIVVRCGGPNAGHTISWKGKPTILRQVPAGVVNPNAVLVVAAGCAVDVDLLAAEVALLGLERERFVVDPRAVIIEDLDRRAEVGVVGDIGSTGSGNGAALAKRMRRSAGVLLAADCGELRRVARVECAADLIQASLDHGAEVIVEGSQGFGLSLLHGPHYPFVTARDTTAAAFASEAGIAPSQVTDVIMVMRTFPIRVGGNSGPLFEETTWEHVAEIGRAPAVYPEFTSVTKRLRRVGKFDWSLARAAARVNRPTKIALMGLDRLDYRNTNAMAPEQLSVAARAFGVEVQAALGGKLAWAGTGFEDQAVNMSTAI